MGAYLNAVEALRGAATAITLHHPGHSDAQRGRGSSSWRGGIDAEFTLAASGEFITVTCQKMKDGERPAAFSFKVTPAPTKLCRDNGSPVNSVVIVPTDTVTTKSKPSGKNQLRLLQELERRAEVAYSVWSETELRDIAKTLGMARDRAQEALLGLRTTGYLVATVGGSHLPHISPRRPTAFSDASGLGVRGHPNLDVSDQVAETSGTTGGDVPPSELSEGVRKPKSGRDPSVRTVRRLFRVGRCGRVGRFDLSVKQGRRLPRM